MTENRFIFKTLYKTNTGLMNICLLLLRCIIGVLLFDSGSGKLFSWFGGYGMPATIQFFSKIGISMPLAYLSSYTEFIGGFLLTVGLLTRPAAFAIMINMLVATIVTLPYGILGPNGAQNPLIFLVIDIVILLAGPMAISIDRLIFRKFTET